MVFKKQQQQQHMKTVHTTRTWKAKKKPRVKKGPEGEF